MHHRLGLFLLALALWAGASKAQAQADSSAEYRLSAQDVVHVSVQGEPDVTVERRIDNDGVINIPLLGAVKVRGLTLGQAQDLIAKEYVDEQIFVRPEVVLSVVTYSPKQVIVLGQVEKQGTLDLPPEVGSMSIVDVISLAGGLTRIGNGAAVRVTRKDDQGAEQSFTVNVEKLIKGHAAADDLFQIYPGDTLYVPERIF